MDLAQLNKRYDGLWRKAERLVEQFLNRQVKAARARPATSGDESAPEPEPAPIPLREIFVAVQCLKRIHEGRWALMTGDADALQSLGSNDAANAAAEEISRRMQSMHEPGREDGDVEDSL